MEQIPEALKVHVKEFLSQVGDRLSCNGCNDWDFSEGQLQVAREFVGDPEAGNLDYTVLAVIKKALGL